MFHHGSLPFVFPGEQLQVVQLLPGELKEYLFERQRFLLEDLLIQLSFLLNFNSKRHD
jgi:hypothetical protein